MKRFSIVTLIFSLLVPILVGGVSAALSASGMASYGSMNKPPLSPPAWVFPVAWTILYLLMGLASYFIFTSDGDVEGAGKGNAIILYVIQLAMNFMWSIIFFNWGFYLFAFVWLMIMWCVVVTCAFRFYDINKMSAYLLLPYIVWLTFAAYLNLGTYLLNFDRS